MTDPSLITRYILGKRFGFVEQLKHLQQISQCVIDERDYFQLQEMVCKTKARLELVCSPKPLYVSGLTIFMAPPKPTICTLKFHVGNYVKNLMQPLRSSPSSNPSNGCGVLAAIIFCETILPLLPTMPVKDMKRRPHSQAIPTASISRFQYEIWQGKALGLGDLVDRW